MNINTPRNGQPTRNRQNPRNNLPRLNQEEIENLKRPITRDKIESVIKKKKKIQQMKVQDQMASKMKSTKYLEELMPILLKNIPKNYSGRNTSELIL